MITMIQPMAIGNALRLYLAPPAGAEYWRVLRKGTADITGLDDDNAVLAYEGDNRVFIDSAFLQNEVKAFYRPFYRINGDWVPGEVADGTPASTYEDYSTEVLGLVRERLEAGLMVEVERQTILNDLGYIQVMTAPPSMSQNISFPLVTVTLEDESPSGRGIGEDTVGDYFDDDDDLWLEQEGWLANVRLSIVGWSLNPTERIELRKAIRRVMVANFTVFADKGVSLPHLSLSDTDAVNGEFETPLYLVNGDFTCTAPVRVGHMAAGTIVDVEAISNG